MTLQHAAASNWPPQFPVRHAPTRGGGMPPNVTSETRWGRHLGPCTGLRFAGDVQISGSEWPLRAKSGVVRPPLDPPLTTGRRRDG